MENKIILITGATSGVGKATAFELAKPENQLFLVARNKQKGEELKKEILLILKSKKIIKNYFGKNV